MKLATQRLLHMSSRRRLARARRLFIYVYFDQLLDHPENWDVLARKLQDRGLYAVTTGTASIRFSIARHLYKVHKQSNPETYWSRWYKRSTHCGWYGWLADHPWVYWYDKDRPKT